MMTPLASEAMSIGTAPAATTMPAAAGSLVSWSVSHGSAIEATPLPVPAIKRRRLEGEEGLDVAAGVFRRARIERHQATPMLGMWGSRIMRGAPSSSPCSNYAPEQAKCAPGKVRAAVVTALTVLESPQAALIGATCGGPTLGTVVDAARCRVMTRKDEVPCNGLSQ